ncbi:MAG: CoA-binding protein [Bacteroidetes bacterium]|nr:CoA-binding protein [Bacteroidota bacterium]
MSVKEILSNAKTIAVIGFSDNPSRPSNRIGRYLVSNKYTVYGVNPKLEGKITDSIYSYGSLSDIPFKIDIVNIFRRSEILTGIVNEVLLLKEKPELIWAQQGVMDSKAKKLAEENDLMFVENKCIMSEHLRLFS